MKTRTKALLLVMSALLLIVSTVFATMAYLTSKTEKITNTFTVGNVAITLDEADLVDEYGVADNSVPRVISNEYKLIPGHTYDKDPTVHVNASSEDCYIFVKVTNNIATIEAATVSGGYTNIADQMTKNGWLALTGEDGVFYYKEKVEKTDGRDYVVFEEFKIAGSVDNTTLEAYATLTNPTKYIEIQAYAIQADGFADAATAYTAAPCSWGP